MATKKGVSLSVGRGEKLPVSKGAGLTAKGRAKGRRYSSDDVLDSVKVHAIPLSSA